MAKRTVKKEQFDGAGTKYNTSVGKMNKTGSEASKKFHANIKKK